jgi:hypothetical protein
MDSVSLSDSPPFCDLAITGDQATLTCVPTEVGVYEFSIIQTKGTRAQSTVVSLTIKQGPKGFFVPDNKSPVWDLDEPVIYLYEEDPSIMLWKLSPLEYVEDPEDEDLTVNVDLMMA